MTPLKMNKLLKGLIGLTIVLVAAVIFVGNNKLTGVATETARLKAEAEATKQQVATYEETKAKVESLDYVDELAAKVLPADKEQSAILAEVSEFALRSGLTISQIAFNDAPASQSAPANSTTPKTKVTTPNGVQVIPVTIEFTEGSQYNAVLDFLKTVEGNQRKMQVTDISITPDAEDRQLFSEVSVSMNLYAKQQRGTKNE